MQKENSRGPYMNAKLITRVQLFNAIVAATCWTMALLFAIGYTAYRILRSEQMGTVDFVIPCVLAIVAMISIRRYIHFRSLHEESTESAVRVLPANQPGRHSGTETITRSQLLYSLAAAIGWWTVLLFSIAYATSILQHKLHMGLALLVIPCSLLLVVIRSTRRYIYLRSLRKAGEQVGQK